MITALNHVNERQQRLFDNTISQIVAALNPEKILCYGNRTHEDSMWSCFLSSQSTRIYTDYDLLIITQGSQPGKEHELRDLLSKYEEESVRITAVTHTIAAVNEALQKGASFFTTVCKSFGLAERFYGAAVDSATNERYDVAAFMLHQSVELACIAAIRTQIGYRPATHNLKRLLALMENFTFRGLLIFPRITNEETELFNVLHRAYSDVRYKEEYKVSGDTVFILIERVKNLLDIAEELYHDKKKSLETLAQASTEIRELPYFESICIDTFADVVLKKGESESIHIVCDKDITHAIKTSVENKRLSISTIAEGTDIFPEAILHITYTELNGLVVNHSGKITCEKPIEAPWLGIIQNGRGNINLEVNVLSLDVTLSKTGNVVVSGSSDEVKVLNHRTGNFDGSKLITTVADIIIHGSGNVSTHVEDELKAELHGTGNLLYSGTPRIASLSMEGTGKLKFLG